jgi:hypothetical protein
LTWLVPAIHVFDLQIQDADARDERGHDEVLRVEPFPVSPQFPQFHRIRKTTETPSNAKKALR